MVSLSCVIVTYDIDASKFPLPTYEKFLKCGYELLGMFPSTFIEGKEDIIKNDHIKHPTAVLGSATIKVMPKDEENDVPPLYVVSAGIQERPVDFDYTTESLSHELDYQCLIGNYGELPDALRAMKIFNKFYKNKQVSKIDIIFLSE
nr:hypothetical protein [Abalone asfa-like virus]